MVVPRGKEREELVGVGFIGLKSHMESRGLGGSAFNVTTSDYAWLWMTLYILSMVNGNYINIYHFVDAGLGLPQKYKIQRALTCPILATA